jgi:hypothetical protein
MPKASLTLSTRALHPFMPVCILLTDIRSWADRKTEVKLSFQWKTASPF